MPSAFSRIGSRGSPLALAQARAVRDRMAVAHNVAPDAIEIRVIRTSGDAIQDRPLADVGGKGLFTKEIEEALLRNEVLERKDIDRIMEGVPRFHRSPGQGLRVVAAARGNQFLNERGVDYRRPLGDAFEGVDEVRDVGDAGLEQVTDGVPAGQQFGGVFHFDVRGQHQDAGVGQFGADHTCRIEALGCLLYTSDAADD